MRHFNQVLAIPLLAALFAGVAQADQCAYVSQAEAERALAFIRVGDRFVNFCEPCGAQNFFAEPVELASSVEVAPAGYEQYWELRLNGQGVDMAYTYVRLSDVDYYNLSKLVECPSQDVSAHFSSSARKWKPKY